MLIIAPNDCRGRYLIFNGILIFRLLFFFFLISVDNYGSKKGFEHI